MVCIRDVFYISICIGGDIPDDKTGGSKTTEFVSCQSPYPMDCEAISRPGPELPHGFLYHCMSKIDNLVILVGGSQGNEDEEATLIVDISNNFTMKYGPQMIDDRFEHSCGSIYHNGKTYMVVAGGRSKTTGKDLPTVELWDPTSDEGWIKGIFGLSLIYFNRFHYKS